MELAVRTFQWISDDSVNQDYESGIKKLSSMIFLVFYAIVRDSTFQYLRLKIIRSFIHKDIIITIVVGR